MNFAVLLEAGKSLEKLNAFIEGDGLFTLLETLGDVSIDAAKFSSQLAVGTKNWHKEIGRTITHLQLSHKAYERALESQAMAYFRMPKWYFIWAKNVYALCTMALCYKYLSENDTVAKMAQVIKEAYVRKEKPLRRLEGIIPITTDMLMANQFIFAWPNPLNWIDSIRLGQKFEWIQEEDLETFIKFLADSGG